MDPDGLLGKYSVQFDFFAHKKSRIDLKISYIQGDQLNMCILPEKTQTCLFSPVVQHNETILFKS